MTSRGSFVAEPERDAVFGIRRGKPSASILSIEC
jgi:hypothetical protein